MTKEIMYVLCAVLLIFFALFQKERFKGMLKDLMINAKSLAKDAILNSGKDQEEWVLEQAYLYLPRWFTLAIPKEWMRKIIAYIYNRAKDYIDDGKLNGSQ